MTAGKRTPHPNSLANLKPPFPKGVSGNPGGRPKKRLIDEVLTELLEAKDSEEAVAIARALIKRARKGDAKVSQLVAERTQGKPKQQVDVAVGGTDGGPITHTIRFYGSPDRP